MIDAATRFAWAGFASARGTSDRATATVAGGATSGKSARLPGTYRTAAATGSGHQGIIGSPT